MLRAGTESGDIDQSKFTLSEKTEKYVFVKGAIAIIDPSPDALRNLKIGFEEERRRGIEGWRAKRAARTARP
jgi:hypothetical protein